MMAGSGRKVVALLLLLLALGSACLAQQTITVPDDYFTIQAAIDAAQAGDTVYIKAGRYTENLTITKPIHLVGEGRTKAVIQSPDDKKNVITISLDQGEVTIETLEVTEGRCGISANVSAAARVEIKDMISYSNQSSIVAGGSGGLVLEESYLIDSNVAALLLDVSAAHVAGNEVLRGGVGIVLVGRTHVTLDDNLIGLCQLGIVTYSASCGFDPGKYEFDGSVAGSGNRVYGLKTDLCPKYPGASWPDGFANLAWCDAIDEAVSDHKRGVALYNAQDYQGALRSYAAGLASLDSFPFPLLVANFNQNIGAVYGDLGRYKDALASYKAARAVYASYGMEVNVAGIDQNSGAVYDDLGRYKDALASYKAARAVYASHGMEVDAAGIDHNSGAVYDDLGRYEDALSKYRSARAVYVAHNMDVDVAGIDQNIGVVYDELGRYDDALSKYRSARAVYASRGMEVDVAMIDTDIGNVYTNLGRYDDALSKYRSARAVFVAHNMDVDVAMIDHNIGAVYDDLGQYEDALTSYKAARKVYARDDMAVNVVEIDVNIGNVYRSRGRYDDALKSYQSAISILDRVPPAAGMKYSYPTTRWKIYANVGVAHERRQNWDAARQSYEKSIAVIESLRGYMRSEKMKTAWQERTQVVYEHLIKLLIEHGHGADAFPYAERCRARTFLDALYQGTIKPSQLISPEAGISSGAVDPTVIDAAIASSRKELQANEAVLEYFVTQDGIYLWLITGDGISAPIFIKYSRDQLMRDVITLRETLESNNPDQSTLTEFLTSFYTKLVKPGLDKLTGRKIDTLVFIPSGPLWYLPFAAVEMSDHQESNGLGTRHPYLVEHYTIAYLPSLASLSSLTKKGTQPISEKPVIALADPEISMTQLQTGSKCEVKPLPRYPGLVKAARAFADELVGSGAGGKYVYAGSKAQEGVAYMVAGDKVEVYAAHGQFNPSVPLESKLLLAPGGEATRVQSDLRNPDGNYHAWEALLTDHRGTELVVLAACESLLPHLGEMTGTLATLGNKKCDQVKLSPEQLKQIVVGDEVVGLARAFLSSGAKSVLGTLWLANPTAVGKLLVAMGEYRKGGDTWAQALAKAQRDLIKDTTFSNPNPWLWAPYQLIGRWR